jgi:hypothetical protein
MSLKQIIFNKSVRSRNRETNKISALKTMAVIGDNEIGFRSQSNC